ncbi:hypothetical protein AMECASPLE_004615 [Ameca splendens]|uniref:Uncharacterized protein n=1 Tax=Ameca splendens TaxID=208324 RepID=A0ABV1A618_9TELE
MPPSADRLYGEAVYIFPRGLAPHPQRPALMMTIVTLCWISQAALTQTPWRIYALSCTKTNNADELQVAIKTTFSSLTHQETRRLISNAPHIINAIIEYMNEGGLVA